MYILIVEDDYLQVDLMEDALRKAPEFASAKIERISTENEFRTRFEEIANHHPNVIIMDVMLRWVDPAPEMPPPPPEVEKDGFYRAGLRNKNLLAQDPRTRSIPVVLYTILENEDLEEGLEQQSAHYLAKDSSLDPLVQKIRSLTGRKVT